MKKADGSISPEGAALAETVGTERLGGRDVEFIMVSHQPRTEQTARAMLKNANLKEADIVLPFVVDALDSPDTKEWIEYIQATEGNLDQDHPFVADEAERMKEDFLDLVGVMPEDGNFVAVGHAGMLEALIEELTGVMLKPLRECEGAIVDRVNGKFQLVEELRR
ncbi:MAG: histidine phosphatase family protein [Patescibacteria group bacterium]